MRAPTEWLEDRPEGALLRVQVQPRARRSEVAEIVAGPEGRASRMKIRIAAPPVDGAANDELVAYLSRALGVPKSRIEIVRGQTGRLKDLLCSGLPAKDVRTRLLR